MTLHPLHRPATPVGDESGVSLIEMLVTTFIFTIVGGLILSAFVSVNNAVAVADNVSFDQGFARNALSLVSRDIRAADQVQQSLTPAFVTAQPREVEFTALLDTGIGVDSLRPQLVKIEVDADSRLVVTATTPSSGSSAPDLEYLAANAQERYVASFVVNTGTIFRFFDDNGVELTDFSDGGNLVEDERREIATVQITIQLNRAPTLTGASELEMTVRLPNAGAEN